MPLPILTTLGLTAHEAETYELLLKLGEVPIAELLKATRHHPPIIYRAIDGLKAKGLATSQVRKRRTFVNAADPRTLVRTQKEKLQEIEAALPDLLALSKHSPAATVILSSGAEAVYDLRARAFEEMKKGDTFYIIGASGDRYYEIMGKKNIAVEGKRIAKKIKKKMLSFESQRALLTKNETQRTFGEYRFLPAKFSVPSSTNIFGNTVAILIWSEDPVVITIHSKEIAQSHRQYFEALWEVGRK